MNKKVSMDELMPIVKETLDNGGKVTFTPKGISMLPLLRNDMDTVTLKKPVFPLKKYDISLYTRSNGKHVLHRVVKVKKDGYVMRGDNQLINEFGVNDNQIIAVVTDFTRKGKLYSVDDFWYRVYCVVWTNTLLLKKIYLKTRRILGKVKRKLIGRC